jgi:C4-dicarboxylate-specific signal transduction histidine kinase
MNRLWRQEQKQFMASKANVDFINSTYHDLKYQINLLKQNPEQCDTLLQNVEKAFQAYDSTVVTGNDTLNVILTERAMECIKNEIAMNCMVDGKLFTFMSDVDLYTLFGNALDNAIEAVRTLEEDRRSISITSYTMGEMFSVCIRTYCDVQPKIENGLPLTTKSNKERHGYGMSSIKRIVEKYGGNMQVVVRDGVFNLTLLFFLK